MKISELAFDDRGLLPVIVQERDGHVLMLGWANAEAIRVTFEKKLATFWSRSRDELWTKGETSGNKLHVDEVIYDCDGDALIYKVRLEGTGACGHFPERSCFFRTLEP